ncbi:MAG: hypothetical protein M3O82_07045 [Verrucomicrobiota bacterium]|nr:hypothetical protein [Verrucomicrobiota bacterium]
MESLRARPFHELLWWCLPALAIGGILRILLEIHFPYGYFQADTVDFLATARQFLKNHSLVLHGKKAFLAPVLFTLPFLIKIPALWIIPAAQHLLGLVLTVISGALTRHWFCRWKWFIIPVTLLTTINPALLWYEHAALAESHYLFCSMALALAGTAFTLRPTGGKLAWVIVALFFTAGSRPEGKLFVAFGILLVTLVYWGEWRRWAKNIAIMLVASGLIWMSSRNTQAGLLLYATVLPLAPDAPKLAPDFGPWINPLRDQYRAEGKTVRDNLVTAEKTVNDVVVEYLRATGQRNRWNRGAFCQKLAVEAMLHEPLQLPVIALNKFLMSCNLPTSGGFTQYWVQDKQHSSFLGKKWLFELMKGLTGIDLRTKEQVIAFINEKYQPLNPDWFAKLQTVWSSATLTAPGEARHFGMAKVPRIPYFFVIVALGMLAAIVRPGALQRFHIAWLLTFFGVWFVVLLTGVVNPRYRFVFEPFCVIYALYFFDAVWSGVESLAATARKPTAAHAEL